MPVFTHDGVDLHYEVRGSGKPMLLLAGLAADSAFWVAAVNTLAERHQVILIDNRGCGSTTPLDAASSVRAMADDSMALARHLRLAKVDIVGHSMGGMIAQACAMHHPQQVDRLVLAATAPVNSARNNDLFATWATMFETVDRATWFRNLFYWVFSARFFDDRAKVEALVQLATGYPLQQSARALRNQITAVAAFDARGALASIVGPTLVLAGAEDQLFPVAGCTAFARALPQASFMAIDGAAHSIPNEFPAQFTRAVLDFMAAPPAR
jgi:pimeloyl-ACP methyl ester carboxylesterase